MFVSLPDQKDFFPFLRGIKLTDIYCRFNDALPGPVAITMLLYDLAGP